MTDTTPPETPRTHRWVKILLALSLGLNLLILGMIVGTVAKFRNPDSIVAQRALQARDLNYGPYTQALTPADRRAIGRKLRDQSGGEIRAALPELRRGYRELLGLLRSDTFDAESAGRIMSAQQRLGLRRQEIGQRLLLERLSAMSASERAGFADRLERALRHRPALSDR